MRAEDKVEMPGRKPPMVVAEADGVPIYAFGNLFINALSPDLDPDIVLQEGNTREKTKIRPKRSWELKENHIGATPPRIPRSPEADFQPYLCINLIDGNPDTYWCSRFQTCPDVEPVWIRIDLAAETSVQEVVLVPRRDNLGIPAELTIRLSRDGRHWLTVYENRSQPAPKKGGEPLRFPLTNPTLAKQVWIVGNNCPSLLGGAPAYCFSIADVQVIDEKGNNVALASRGAGVTVSSTNYGFQNTCAELEMYWPLHYDLGCKWIRIGYCNYPYTDTLTWDIVEQKKGEYVIDRRTDEAVTETAANGCKIILCLCYGNWIYTPEGAQELPKNVWTDRYTRMPPGPLRADVLEGYKNYVRFMVRHFKDRIQYFEIYNEPATPYHWGLTEYPKGVTRYPSAKQYCDIVRAVAPIIREESPTAKIVLASAHRTPTPQWRTRFNDRWLYECIDDGIGLVVDVLAWHPIYGDDPLSWASRHYADHIRQFQRYAEERGFRGEYLVSEFSFYAGYPPPSIFYRNVSEMQKARDTARALLTHLGLGLTALWNETWQTQITFADVGLLRNTFSADPISPATAQPAYYVLRTLCTVMEGATPTEQPVALDDPWRELDSYSFALPGGGMLVGVWLPGPVVPGVNEKYTSDVRVKGLSATSVWGIDVLNGTEQELQWHQEGADLVVPGVILRDHPLLLRLRGVQKVDQVC